MHKQEIRGERFAWLLPLNRLKRLTAAGLPSPSSPQWSRNRSRISNTAKHDGLAVHSDTRSIRGRLVHCRNERSSSRNSNDVWMVPFAWLLPCCPFDVARGGNRSMAHSSAAIHLNLTRELRTFLCRSVNSSAKYIESLYAAIRASRISA